MSTKEGVMVNPSGGRAPASPDDPNDRKASPAELMRVLKEDVHQVRVGNIAPETVPVFSDRDDPRVRYVRFSDLSANARHILDVCEDVEVRVDGSHRFEGERQWREIDGRRGPVLQWTEPKRD